MGPTIAELAERAHLRLITCERGLGKMQPTACVMRWLIAAGRAPGAPGVRESRCRECEHGEARLEQLSDREQRQVIGKLGVKKLRKPQRPPRPPTQRKCAAPGCDVTFELRGAMDGNKRYHSEECRIAARAAARAAGNLARRGARPRYVPKDSAQLCSACGAPCALGRECDDNRCVISRAVQAATRVG